MLLLRGLLALTLATSAASAAPFTVRVDDDADRFGEAVRIRLFEACSSYDCGLGWLAESPPAFRPPVVAGPADGTGIIRGTVPEDGLAWWVVAEGGTRMPMALLWRPEAAPGDLPAPPAVEGSPCRIAASDSEGNPVAAALVAANAAEEEEEEEEDRRRPSVFSTWRPWLPPGRTDERGIVSIVVPAGESVEVRVAAPGFRHETTTCLLGSVSTVRLDRASTTAAEVRDMAGQVLSGALVRNDAGVPLAVTDPAGRFELEAVLGSRRLWFELPNGAVYTGSAGAMPPDARSRLVQASSYSELRTGRIQLMERAQPRDAIYYWREARWPWRSTDARAAPLPMRADDLSYAIHMLPGEGLWFGGEGVGYAVCGFGGALSASGSAHVRLGGRRPVTCPPPLRKARMVAGVVVDETGAPVADADVWLSWGFGHEPNEPTVLPARRLDPSARMLFRSDSQGRFGGGRFTRPTRSTFGAATANPVRWLSVTAEHPAYLPLLRKPLRRFVSNHGEPVLVLRTGARVTGRVVDAATGEPVGAAEVALGRFGEAQGEVLLRPLSLLDPSNGQFGRLRSGHADPSGYFELTVSPGSYDLAAQAPGKAFFVRRGIKVGPEGIDLGAVPLKFGRSILGEVLDQDLNPVPGARILAAGVPEADAGQRSTGLHGWSRLAADLWSDALGQFRVDGLNDHSLIDLEVSASGLATKRFFAVGPTGPTPVQLMLPPEGVVQGRVTYAGEPAATWVRFEKTRKTPSDRSIEAPTARNGIFRVAGLEAGQYDVVADGGRELDDARTSLRVTAGETVEVALELGDAKGSVVGAVTANGGGLPGVTIRAGKRQAVTDSAGRYRLDRLPRGHALVSATWPKADAEGLPLTIDESVDVGSTPPRLDFDFTAFEVRGRVVGAAGSPAPGLKLLFLRRGGGMPPLKEAVAGSDGSFHVELVAGAYDVMAPGMQNGDVPEPLRVKGPRSDVEIRLPVNLRIEGVARGLSAEALESLEITARNDEMENHSGIVDTEGRFTIDGLSSRSWLVVGRVVGAGRRAERRVRIEGAEAYVELEFVRLPVVRGTVRLDGAPVQGAPVFLLRGRELAGGRREWTRYDGSFRFVDLLPGEYTLGTGAEMRTLSVRDDEVISIDLASGRIEGTVEDPATSRPLAGSAVYVWPRAARRPEAEALGLTRRSFTDANGRFSFEQIPEGSWLLEVEGTRKSRTTVEVEPGSSSVLRVR